MPSVLSTPIPPHVLELMDRLPKVLKEHRLAPSQNECLLIKSLVRSGHVAHGKLTASFGGQITLGPTNDFVEYLKKNYFNHVTCSGQIKKNVRHERGEWLCHEKLRKEFSVFDNVLDSLLELSYVNEESIGISATLTKEYCSGTEHTDRQGFAIRLIFTFLLKRGTGGAPGAKDFLFRHPLYHGKYEENHDSMFVRSHEFIAIDEVSSGRVPFEDRKIFHQALANDSDVLTLVLSIFGSKVPPLTQFMSEWKRSGAFESLESNYLN